MVFNIGCDSGYGYTMSCSSLGESKFSSYIEKITERKAMSLKDSVKSFDENNILVKYEDDYYVVGRLCERHFMDSTRRIDLNRVGNKYHLIQLLTSICLNASNTSNININLMAGLPIRSKDDRAKFKKWLEDKKFSITFLTKEKDYVKVVNINKCYCSLQPIFPIFSALLPEDQVKNILSLDIGYSSTDGVRFEGGGMSESNQDQIDLIGTHRILTELEEEIIGKYKGTYSHLLSISERSLQMALETGVFSINGKPVDISDVLDSALENYAEYMFKEIQRRYIQKLSDIDVVLVSGGLACSEIFMRRLANKFKGYQISVVTSKEPQWDICRGMKIFLDELEEDDFNSEPEDTLIQSDEIELESDK